MSVVMAMMSSSAGNSSSISSRSISSSSTSSSSSSISISSRSSTEAVAVTAVEVFVFSGAGGGSDMCKIVLHEEEKRVPNKRDGSNDSVRKGQLYKIDKNRHSRADVKGTESSTRRILVLQSVRRQPTGCQCRW
uniref:Uncharacterized protein n=1 Tax=Vespula pensylvanica TaxID=30213 RepID=A0A834KTL5_VESPE|nr:hypothetical protein H0235_012657 [Vespula pensylvanica]